MLIDQAGVDIRKYAIWQDRFALLAKVTEPDLAKWLGEQVAAVATSAPGGSPEVTAEPSAASGAEISQFAVEATASSEMSATDGSAMQATGAPDTAYCGDHPTAWSSARDMPGAALTLLYNQRVIPKRLVIHETYRPGAIYTVEVLLSAGPVVVYEASPMDNYVCPYEMRIDITDVNEPVSMIRLILAQEGEMASQIDAVELIGIRP